LNDASVPIEVASVGTKFYSGYSNTAVSAWISIFNGIFSNEFA
jgi:hypothetical protein